jgi:glycosyltransferase involved in cell wall biosynthesis
VRIAAPSGPFDPGSEASDGPLVRLESPLPVALPAGSSLAVYCSGFAWDSDRPVRAIHLAVDGVPHPVGAVAMPRFDLPHRRSGFWGVIPVRVAPDATEVVLGVEATLHDGARHSVELARIPVEPASEGRPWPPATGEGPGDTATRAETIAICMATFEPDLDLLRAQIDSIRAQTDRDWICVVSDDCSGPQQFAAIREIIGDDARFQLSQTSERSGFYRNFERALSVAPPDAELIALSDQDDVWHPNKLATLRASLGAAPLVYSDLRLVDEDLGVLRNTLWKGRSNNQTNMASMLVANTVTGSSCLFRREVAELALPFPDCPGLEFHDHWIALVALALGDLAYVDRPLYDYVQHRAAILGRSVSDSSHARPRLALRPPELRRWRAAYFLGYVPGEVRARTLLLRCGPSMIGAKRRALDRYIDGARRPFAFVWLITRPLRILAGRTETLGSEWEIAPGIIWSWLAAAAARMPLLPDRYTLDTRFPDPPHFEQKRLRRWRETV